MEVGRRAVLAGALELWGSPLHSCFWRHESLESGWGNDTKTSEVPEPFLFIIFPAVPYRTHYLHPLLCFRCVTSFSVFTYIIFSICNDIYPLLKTWLSLSHFSSCPVSISFSLLPFYSIVSHYHPPRDHQEAWFIWKETSRQKRIRNSSDIRDFPYETHFSYQYLITVLLSILVDVAHIGHSWGLSASKHIGILICCLVSFSPLTQALCIIDT